MLASATALGAGCFSSLLVLAFTTIRITKLGSQLWCCTLHSNSHNWGKEPAQQKFLIMYLIGIVLV